MTRTDTLASPRSGRVGILAGTGRLPQLVAENLAKRGLAPFIGDLTDKPMAWASAFETRSLKITQLSTLLSALRTANVHTVIMAGGIAVRPKWTEFRLDWITVRELPRLISALRKGDDALLREAINLLERYGFTVIGAHESLPSLLSDNAVLTIRQPTNADLIDITRAKQSAIDLGRRDVGQAAVARGGKTIAIEDSRGTAVMLAQLAVQRPQTPSGVLAKFAKPDQEMRADLPSIGPDTVYQAVAAGLCGIVVEAGRAIIIDREHVVALANENKIFVMGLEVGT
jgi:UDP-2,3-diacylglucosamine hydrolase